MPNKEEYEKALKLRKLVQEKFNVPNGEDIVFLANSLSAIILQSDATTLYKTFGYNQTNRLALRRLQSAFKILKQAKLLKINY